MKKFKINGLYYLRSLRGARKIKYVWAFNRIHRSTALDSARRHPQSWITPEPRLAR